MSGLKAKIDFRNIAIVGFAFNIYFICKLAFLLVTRNRRWVTLAAGAAWCILIAINLALMVRV